MIFGERSPSCDVQTARRGWVEPLLNAAVVVLLIGPLVIALGWSLIESVLDQL